jgi:hypothetical protein
MHQCSSCEIETNLTYYCEIWDSDFCSQCTIKEAHVEDPNKSNDMAECKNIHL